MKTIISFKIISLTLAITTCILILTSGVPAYAESKLDEIIGREGQMKEGSLVYQFPRSDLKMLINGERIPTVLGFGSWTAFKKTGESTMVMGDLVLLEKEVNPVISSLAKYGIKVTALHNHFFGDKPRVMFLHIEGMGNDADLARGIRSALDKTTTPIKSKAKPSTMKLKMDTAKVETIVGHTGQENGGVFKIVVGRSGVKMGETEITSSMGMNSWAGFVGTDERAHVAGDIVMTASEVNPVIQALRKGSIEVVAVHNHMLDEQPKVFFLHYWGTGPSSKLAETIREVFAIVKNPAQ